MFASTAPVEREIVARTAALDPGCDALPGHAEGSLERAFQGSGGVATAEEVAVLLRRRCDQPLSQLARWIVGRQVIHFESAGQTLLPLFQFDLDDMSIRPAVGAVLQELSPAFEPAVLAQWLATPNAWLAGETPLRRLGQDPELIAEAARADRFATTGWA